MYGTDIPSVHELIGNGRTEEQIAAAIGVDHLIYQDLSDLIEAAHEGNPKIQQFDAFCFDGQYITGDVSRDYLERIERARCDTAKTGRGMGQGGNDHVSAMEGFISQLFRGRQFPT